VHPSPFGQALYFATIKKLLSLCFNDSPVATISTALPQPVNKNSINNGRYYDLSNAKTDANWQLVKDWSPTDSLGTREGFVHVPMLVSNSPGATLQLPFKGTAVGISIISGGDAGMVEYNIDHSAFKTIDLYTQWSSFLHLPWYLLLGSGLKEAQHTLTLRISNNKNTASRGNACRIVHFLVNGAK